MPILSRYFLRLFMPVFFLSLSILAGVLLMNHFLKLFNMAVMKGISPLWIAGCFARLFPFICSLALPMAFLLALLLTLGQLSESGEVTALRASGFSFFEMTWPFLGVSAAMCALLLYLNHKASPEGFHSFRTQYLSAAQQIARVDLEPGAFVRLGPWKLYAREVDPDTGRLGGVYLVRLHGATQAIRVNASKGFLRLDRGRGVTLELLDGDLQLPNDHDPSRFTSGTFRRYTIEVPLLGTLETRSLDIQEMNTATLRRKIQEPQTSPQHRIEYTVEIAVRTAGALSPLVFFWIGAPLGMRMGRHSRGRGFAAALAILLLFYALTTLGIGLGRRHAEIASVAPWMANAVGLAMGLALTRRSSKR